MRKRYYIPLLLCLLLLACTPSNNVGFTYSPDQPRAGQIVTFTNTSESGSEWEWDFGDNATSIGKNPTHIYRRIGTYTVTLRVDGRRAWTASRQVQVVDTVPRIACLDDASDTTGVVDVFAPLTFVAAVYNPYYHPMDYRWTVDSSALAVYPDSLTGRAVTLRVDRPMEAYTLGLMVRDRRTDSTYYTTRSFVVRDVAAMALCYTMADGTTGFQRVYGAAPAFYEQIYRSGSAPVLAALATAQDTSCVYADQTYDCARVSGITGSTVLGFTIRGARIYFRTADGLYVCGMQGANRVTIAEGEVYYVTCNAARALIYFATSDGVYSLPLIQSPNNRFDPETLLPCSDCPTVRSIGFSDRDYLLRELL